MKYIIERTSQFKKDFKQVKSRGCDLNELKAVIRILANGDDLPKSNKDHALNTSKNYKGMRECHIRPDWLLVYSINKTTLILRLIRTGSHSDIF
ncbi:type II toxin-antitoxin system YafQ family toxin [Aminicella lysinilytica]|jgi:mRNA interferase YafQ|uniref:mRNA interferase YafQ n=1 Tax=Aminicella lysinilytica TaxID=433323 RepID=A0A4R6Q3K8_9FIRM|nr:type II toxin-antitoxin system YafQ family toxin [Aminicella lysinilytica]TDP56430.1 mRNA interferase YafQ [Aminicella lysinilytica]